MDWRGRTDDFERILKIVAVIVAACWVSFKTLRGRIFVPRLQLKLSGKFFCKESVRYLLVTMQVKNVGSSIVRIKQEGTVLEVTRLSPKNPSTILKAPDEATELFDILKRYPLKEGGGRRVRGIDKIEPGTAVMEQKLIRIPEDHYPDLEIELRVCTQRPFGMLWWFLSKTKELLKKLRKELRSRLRRRLRSSNLLRIRLRNRTRQRSSLRRQVKEQPKKLPSIFKGRIWSVIAIPIEAKDNVSASKN